MAISKTYTVELTGDLGLRQAPSVMAQLKAALAQHASVTIATDGLTGIDLTILQVLLAAHRTAAATGKTLQLKAPANGLLRTTLAKAGLGDRPGAAPTPEGRFWAGSAGELKGRAA